MTIKAKGGMSAGSHIYIFFLIDFPYTFILAKMGQNYLKIVIFGAKNASIDLKFCNIM